MNDESFATACPSSRPRNSSSSANGLLACGRAGLRLAVDRAVMMEVAARDRHLLARSGNRRHPRPPTHWSQARIAPTVWNSDPDAPKAAPRLPNHPNRSFKHLFLIVTPSPPAHALRPQNPHRASGRKRGYREPRHPPSELLRTRKLSRTPISMPSSWPKHAHDRLPAPGMAEPIVPERIQHMFSTLSIHAEVQAVAPF